MEALHVSCFPSKLLNAFHLTRKRGCQNRRSFVAFQGAGVANVYSSLDDDFDSSDRESDSDDGSASDLGEQESRELDEAAKSRDEVAACAPRALAASVGAEAVAHAVEAEAGVEAVGEAQQALTHT